MRVDVNHNQDIVSESLKSKYGAKINRNLSKAEKSGLKNDNGMKEYILQESWFKAVRIRTTPLNEVTTAVTFKVHYTNRFQELLVVLTLGVLIFFPQLSALGYLPPMITLTSLVVLIFAPGYLIQPLVSEVQSYLQEIPNNASHIAEKFSSEINVVNE